MKAKDKYLKKWRDAIISASSALENGDYDIYDNLMNEANRIVDMIKRDDELTYECNNFGLSNYVFESALPKLFKSNKAAVKEFIKTIKEDSNLLNQFYFFKALENYKPSLKSTDYINETLSLLYKNIDKKSLNESNKKLSDIIKKYDIKPCDKISEDKLTYFNSCDFLFKNKKSIKNISLIKENYSIIKNYMENNFKEKATPDNDMIKKLCEYDIKYSKLLSNDEKKFIKEIINANENDAMDKLQALKNECVNRLSDMISKCDNKDDLNGLLEIKEQIDNKVYSKDTLIKDVVDMLDIVDVLNS